MASRTDLVAAATATPEVANGKAVASAGKTIFDLLQDQQDQLVMAMASEAGARRLTRILMTEIRRNPKLAECTIPSLLGAAMQCAQVNLEPGTLGQVYLIPRRNNRAGITEVNWQLGYKGMIELALRTGKVKSIYASEVCENDIFVNRTGYRAEFVHEVDYRRADRGAVYAYYAYADVGDEGHMPPLVMRLDDIYDRHRSRSDAYNRAETGDRSKGGGKKDSPWHTDERAMCLKTVVRQLWTWLPKSVEMMDAYYADEAVIDADLVTGPAGIRITRQDLEAGEELAALEEAPPVTIHGDTDETVVHPPADENGEPWDRPAPGAIETMTGVGPVSDAYTYDMVMAAAVAANLIPASAKEAPARKALHGIINEALGEQVPLIDDAITQRGPEIVAYIATQKGAE